MLSVVSLSNQLQHVQHAALSAMADGCGFPPDLTFTVWSCEPLKTSGPTKEPYVPGRVCVRQVTAPR